LAILNLLIERDFTAEELAKVLKLNVNGVRRHLENMVISNLVSSFFERKGRGRPKKVYSITLIGRELLYSKYDFFLESLVKILIREEGLDKVRRIFKLIGESMSNKEDKIKFLTDLGFKPFETKDTLVSLNCPLLRLAKAYPELVCEAFHGSLLRKLYEAKEVRLIETMAKGAKECKHQILFL